MTVIRSLAPAPLYAVALSVGALSVGAFATSPLVAQTIDVRLEVRERTGGVVEARFDSAFRGLEEVEVAEPGEPAHYALNVSVLCVPRADACDSADSYAVSIVLSEPLTPGSLKGLLELSGERELSGWTPSPEAATNLQRFRRMHALWSTWWGRDRFGAELDGLVRSIDLRCFEKRRILERMAVVRARGDTAAARGRPLTDPFDEGEWLC